MTLLHKIMRCAVCKRTSEEVQLFEGIMETEMVNICEYCAEDQSVPIIKKPSESQLSKADERYSVRERMERMSGMRERTEISKDQMITQGNLARLKAPPKKQHNEDVLDNYYWTLSIARRRSKLSVNQLADKMQTTPEVIKGIEKGRIPEDFKEIFLKLEAFFGIKLLKEHKPQVSFKRNRDEEERILKEVARKLSTPKGKKEDEEEIKEKIEKMDKIERTEKRIETPRPVRRKHVEPIEADFSIEEDLSNVTLSDLIERKKRMEKRKAKLQEDEMLGDDIDIEDL